MLVKIVNVTIERVKSGKKDYEKAQVIYSFNGQARTQNIISFANPAVFATVKEWSVELPEGEVNVEVGKNDAGYNEWRSIGGEGAGNSTTTAAPAAPKSTSYSAPSRDFETSLERAKRQVLIVKQSSLTASLKFLEGQDPSQEQVKAVAQDFTDWVFEGVE